MTQTQQPAQPRKAHPFILSRNPTRALQDMLGVIGNLKSIYEKETDALINSDTQTFLNLQEEKLMTAQHYQDGVSQIIERKNEMQNTSSELRQKIKDMQEELFKLGQQNSKALERMKKGVDRLGSTLRQAARKEAEKSSALSYGATGRIHKDNNKTISTGSISETA